MHALPTDPSSTTVLSSSNGGIVALQDRAPFERPLYSFTQTSSSLEICTLLNENHGTPQVQLKEESIRVFIDGETEPRICGKLFKPIDPYDVTWQLETVTSSLSAGRPIIEGGNDDYASNETISSNVASNAQHTETYKLLTIHCEKIQEEEWPVLCIGGLETPQDMDAHSLYTLASISNYDTSIPLLEAACAKNYIPALLKIAAIYEVGQEDDSNIPVPKTPSKALAYHIKAAELGSPEAAYIVACCYAQKTHGTDDGKTTAQVLKEAIRWYDKTIDLARPFASLVSIKNILVSAAFSAGLLFLGGANVDDSEGAGVQDGIQPDALKALSYWTLAAHYDHAPSLYNLGLILLENGGEDTALSIKYLLRARELDTRFELPVALQGLKNDDLEAVVALSLTMPESNIDEVVWMVRNGGGVTKELKKELKEEKRKKKKKTKKVSKVDDGGVESGRKKHKTSGARDKEGNGALKWVMGLGLVAGVAAAGYFAYKRFSR